MRHTQIFKGQSGCISGKESNKQFADMHCCRCSLTRDNMMGTRELWMQQSYGYALQAAGCEERSSTQQLACSQPSTLITQLDWRTGTSQLSLCMDFGQAVIQAGRSLQDTKNAHSIKQMIKGDKHYAPKDGLGFNQFKPRTHQHACRTKVTLAPSPSNSY